MVKIYISSNGVIRYYNELGLYHRINGPATISWLSKRWYKNGKPHRLDGPAIMYLANYSQTNEKNVWCYNGKTMNCHSQEEFEKLIKLSILW